MLASFLSAASLSWTLLSAPALANPPTDCGLNPQIVPEFSLVDMNTHSPTYGQTVDRDDHLGEVMVIYFAYAP